MSDNSIQNIMSITLDKIRALADAQTIIGDQIALPDGVVLIPVSKMSVGLASGGSDFAVKNQTEKLFGGGGGAGVSITPVAFIAVKDGEVRVMPIYKDASAMDRAVNLVPELFDRITALFQKKKEKSAPKEPEIPQF